MKILVISDSHGNVNNVKHVMGFAKKIGVSAVIHCGDWDNIACLDAVLSFRIPLYSVLGNADVDPKLKEKLEKNCQKFDEDLLIISLDGKRVCISHYLSKLKNVKEKFDVGFYGHRHSFYKEEIEGIKFIRPGSLNKSVNFIVYDTNTDKEEDIHQLF